MNHSVPQWGMKEEGQANSFRQHGAFALTNVDALSDGFSMWDNEVAELTWQNGQLEMNGLGPPKPTTCKLRHAWDAHQVANGTLECIVNQGTSSPVPGKNPQVPQARAFSPWFTDALVPCSSVATPTPTPNCTGSDHFAFDIAPSSNFCSCLGSCECPFSSHGRLHEKEDRSETKHQSFATVPEVNHLCSNLYVSAVCDLSSKRQDTVRSVSGVGNFTMGTGYPSNPLETCGSSDYAGGLNTFVGSPENASTTKDDQCSVYHSKGEEESDQNRKRKGKRGCSSISSRKRSRAASVHNQSERKRRDRINEKMKILQKLIPNSSKTDKASILDEVIEYLKQLQTIVQLISQTSMQMMMMPMNIQQLQTCMLAQMSMCINTGIPPILRPTNFMPPNSIAATATATASSCGNLKETVAGASLPQPISAISACQAQIMNADHLKVAALYQQLFRPPPSNANGSED